MLPLLSNCSDFCGFHRLCSKRLIVVNRLCDIGLVVLLVSLLNHNYILAVDNFCLKYTLDHHQIGSSIFQHCDGTMINFFQYETHIFHKIL
ncbi:hypothetical protein BpHYR1_052850 [Brachionus plicatilis]|uniref:Uncharacterized protein n=1 Tax=Brachionus plicatilis TaxID=10195 RepID=A0A3M7RIV9_BRAPC|nr:hypothetical protein BpHYR1_052850 [Brachionus plicatilis]